MSSEVHAVSRPQQDPADIPTSRIGRLRPGYPSAAEFRDEIRALMKRGVELEYAYAEDTMPRGVLGLNAAMFKEYLRFIANRRCQQIGIDALFDKADNPFPWMSEMIDLKKEKNFFETRVTEYQTGGALAWD